MPPSQFLKQSKTKMQAWVTNNGLSNSQSAPIGPVSGYDGPSSPPKRHVYLPQPVPSATQPSQTAQTTEATQNSPPRSRAPIVNANSTRAAMTAAARLPVPSHSSHARNASLNMARTRTIASEPVQQPSRRQMPFWEGSTIDGSVFSDTASNLDANSAGPSQYRMPVQAPIYQPRDTPRPRPIKKEPSVEERQPPPFVIASNGRIDVVGGPLTRSASTPDARNHRGKYKENSSETDQYSDGSEYQASPEKSPSVKRLHHAKPLTLRTNNQRGSFSERTTYPQDENVISSPQTKSYQGPEDDLDDIRSERSERSAHLRVKVHDPQRSTIFADTDTPMVSHPGESEDESVDQPTPKAAAKTKPQVSRQLFVKNNKNRLTLHESPMPRPTVEKRQPSSKKRQYELDYDDGALAAMDYNELKSEAFDFDPARAEMQSAVGPPRGTLPEKLDHFLDKDQASQMEFFTKMPIKDWENSGDWFLERFTEVMQRLKESRQAKRAMVENFENEVAERQEAVKNKIQGIGQTLADLKNEGEGLMAGKEFG
ncbi:extracellular mutant protein 11-domain-containing protein [Whalleya microplaca]|nr:extracellular mutant protein 11-domain-containing protein [Whalleya microplaca]